MNERDVQEIVKQVVAKLQLSDQPASSMQGVFSDMNEAIEAAKAS